MTIENAQIPTLHEIFSVRETITPGVVTLDIDLTDMNGERYRCNYVSDPNDTFGLNPTIRQWLVDNPDFPIEPYVAPTIEEIRAAMPAITPRQLRLTLVRNGYSLANVDAAIAGLPDGPAKDEASIEWEYGTSFDRNSPTLLAIADAMAMTPEAVDAMWSQAATL